MDPRHKNLKPFKPGQSGNPSGKPKQLLTQDKVSSVMGKFADMTRDELQKVIQNPRSTMLEITVASILAQAAKSGDATRLSFLLDRSIGRVKETHSVEMTTHIGTLPSPKEALEILQADYAMLPAPPVKEEEL